MSITKDLRIVISHNDDIERLEYIFCSKGWKVSREGLHKWCDDNREFWALIQLSRNETMGLTQLTLSIQNNIINYLIDFIGYYGVRCPDYPGFITEGLFSPSLSPVMNKHSFLQPDNVSFIFDHGHLLSFALKCITFSHDLYQSSIKTDAQIMYYENIYSKQNEGFNELLILHLYNNNYARVRALIANSGVTLVSRKARLSWNLPQGAWLYLDEHKLGLT